MRLRPGVTVQEFSFPKAQPEGGAAGGGDDRKGIGEGRPKTAEVLKSRSGPAELQVPGKLSRSAYRVKRSVVVRRLIDWWPFFLDNERQ